MHHNFVMSSDIPYCRGTSTYNQCNQR